tara:strand:+ start:2050 stop:2166 length:117 start_codon:yes stop_codon:yes gene_type:complete
LNYKQQHNNGDKNDQTNMREIPVILTGSLQKEQLLEEQ